MAERRGAIRPHTQKDADMAIDFGRESKHAGENREDREREERRPKRNIPVAGLIRAAASIDEHMPALEYIDEPTGIVHAATTGFTSGSSEEMSPASALGAIAHVAEAAEQGITGAPVDHLERFPELRETELATGAAARFPELSEKSEPSRDSGGEEEADSRLARSGSARFDR